MKTRTTNPSLREKITFALEDNLISEGEAPLLMLSMASGHYGKTFDYFDAPEDMKAMLEERLVEVVDTPRAWAYQATPKGVDKYKALSKMVEARQVQ